MAKFDRSKHIAMTRGEGSGKSLSKSKLVMADDVLMLQEHHGEELANWCEPCWVICIPQQSTLHNVTFTLPLVGKDSCVCHVNLNFSGNICL